MLIWLNNLLPTLINKLVIDKKLKNNLSSKK